MTRDSLRTMTTDTTSSDSSNGAQNLAGAFGAGSPVVLQVGDLLDSVGLGAVAEQIGVWPTVILAVVLTAVIFVLVFGGKAWINRAREASRAQVAGQLREDIEDESNDAEVIQKVNEEDNDILTEATQRLDRRGEDLDGEALTEVLREIEEEEAEEEDSPTGLLGEEGDRSPVARMSIAPDDVEQNEDYITVRPESGERFYARTVIISSYPDRVGFGWLDKLFSSGLETKGADVRTSYHINPRDPETMMAKLNKRATRLTSTIRRKERDGKINTTEEKQQRQKVQQLRDRLNKGATKIFDFALYVQVVAKDKEPLDDGTEEVKQMFAQSNARVSALVDRQLDAFRSVAPLGQDRIRKTQIMDMQSLGTTFPFIEPTRVQSTGVLFGFHHTTNSPVIVDRFELSGHNALVSGKIGSGKSYLSKLMMWRRLMMDPETELMIIDPVGGFGDMVDALGGQVITVDKDTIINPLEIQEAQETVGEMEDDPYDMKIRSVMGMFQTHFSGSNSLDKGEEGVLRRAIKFAYLEKGITKNPRTHSRESPIIQDVIDILKEIANGKQPKEFLNVDEDMMKYVGVMNQPVESSEAMRKNQEREAGFAHQVLLGLEEFTEGGQRDRLNGHTNINLNARVVQFNLENVVDANNAGLIMHIMLDYLFQRTKSSQGRSLITVDEAHYMLGAEGATDVLNTFVRHSRHYQSGVTLISQTVDEFMEGKAKEIYDQCDIRVLMKHEDIGPEAMDALGLEPPERDFVLGAQAGNTSDHSECLLTTTGFGKRRLRVYANTFEHHVVDAGADNIWTLLYKQGSVNWESIPDGKKAVVSRELEGTDVVTPR
jgi:Domain of unknown function DUF87.